MKRISSQPIHLRRWVFLSVCVLSSPLLLSSSGLLAASETTQTGWQFEVAQDGKTRSNVEITNRCRAPHLFRIKSDVKYLSFGQPKESIPVAPGAAVQVPVVFSAAGLKPKVYRNKVFVECLDCKTEKGCSQNRDVLPITMKVNRQNIYSWCVTTKVVHKGFQIKCEIRSVTPNDTPEPCNQPLLTIPNTGAPYPKVGDVLNMTYCPEKLLPIKKGPLGGDLKPGIR
jgi:hypothetical protein